ncbi:MAG: peptide chain release factor 2 [Clostridia bacterium]
MDFDGVKIFLNELILKLKTIKHALDIENKKQKVYKLEELTLKSGFFEDNIKSLEVLSELKVLKSLIEKIEKIEKELNDAFGYLELAIELNDIESFKESQALSKKLQIKIDKLEIDTLLSDEYDANNAILTIHPGAGGTESQDWALMIYRMYGKWCIKNNFEIEILDMQDGDEAGIKSVSFLVHGLNSYGYLKGENGVHRLVRISPFDSNSRRHTSFAAVEVLPEISDDISVQIRPQDLEMDVYRASGAGGQHVNKTSSAVRLRHLPSGIVVTCQTERSQLQNREYALKMLRSKLYKIEKENYKKKMSNIKGQSASTSWGNQIRSYIFCPYTLVKDHRTNCEIGNVDAVMDGEIDTLIYEYLKFSKSNDTI